MKFAILTIFNVKSVHAAPKKRPAGPSDPPHASSTSTTTSTSTIDQGSKAILEKSSQENKILTESDRVTLSHEELSLLLGGIDRQLKGWQVMVVHTWNLNPKP